MQSENSQQLTQSETEGDRRWFGGPAAAQRRAAAGRGRCLLAPGPVARLRRLPVGFPAGLLHPLRPRYAHGSLPFVTTVNFEPRPVVLAPGRPHQSRFCDRLGVLLARGQRKSVCDAPPAAQSD